MFWPPFLVVVLCYYYCPLMVRVFYEIQYFFRHIGRYSDLEAQMEFLPFVVNLREQELEGCGLW